MTGSREEILERILEDFLIEVNAAVMNAQARIKVDVHKQYGPLPNKEGEQ